jgi:hypothetical protein
MKENDMTHDQRNQEEIQEKENAEEKDHKLY